MDLTSTVVLDRTEALGEKPSSPSRSPHQRPGLLGVVDSQGLARGTALIRATVTRWYGRTSEFDAAARQRELAEREACVRALSQLYASSYRHAVAGTWRVVRESDIESCLTLLRRLSLVQKISMEEVAAWCVVQANNDTNAFAHCIDPFQTRFALAFHRNFHHQELTEADIEALKTACRNQDIATIGIWFEAAGAGHASLPRDAGQYLRFVLLELWNEGIKGLDTVAFDQAVLEVRMFGDIGWENTRSLCSLLKRMSGSACSAFNAYLTDEDIDEALLLNQELGNEEECAHYRALAAKYRTETLRDLRRAAFDQAQRPNLTPQPQSAKVAPKPAPARSFKTRLLSGLGFAPAATH